MNKMIQTVRMKKNQDMVVRTKKTISRKSSIKFPTSKMVIKRKSEII